ncbi:MAG: M20/M25/M40 family metallo-hydrolase [Gemmatimonadota bacterium]
MTRRFLAAIGAGLLSTALQLSTAAAQGTTPAAALMAQRIADAEPILSALVESYGVSGMEGPVRETVIRFLPSWAKAETDTAGNLWVRAGSGDPQVVFVAHMDEIGYRVTALRDDGSLDLERMGGFYTSLYEGRPALVHTGNRTVPGVFVPRETDRSARTDGSPKVLHTPPPLRVDVGSGSRAATEALGIRVGNTISMPKSYQRFAGTRATGRSFDDRVGCTALLLALRGMDPKKLRHEVAFIFSVREETGLDGARVVANALGIRPARVHAIDTFVSADSPLENPAFAVAPLGQGAVVRALDNSSVTPPAYVDTLRLLARGRSVALQVGTTNGGNDGSTFASYGVPDVPMGWPLRYSHSPAEVIDLKDVVSLGEMVLAAAESW